MNKHSINKININFEFNTLDEANDFITKARNLSSLLKTSENLTPPPAPQKVASKTPPPAPQKVEQQIDPEKLRTSINDRMVEIQRSTNNARVFLNNKGYTAINLIPDHELVSFLEYIQSGSYE